MRVPNRGGTAASRGRAPLDAQVAVRVFGYRWVEWNHALLRGAPLDEPGRFLARPDHVLAHLQVPAAPSTAPGEQPFRLVPGYSTDLNHAIEAAEHAGLFADAGATLRRAGDRGWLLEVLDGTLRMTGERLPALICEATLAYLDRIDQERARARTPSHDHGSGE